MRATTSSEKLRFIEEEFLRMEGTRSLTLKSRVAVARVLLRRAEVQLEISNLGMSIQTLAEVSRVVSRTSVIFDGEAAVGLRAVKPALEKVLAYLSFVPVLLFLVLPLPEQFKGLVAGVGDPTRLPPAVEFAQDELPQALPLERRLGSPAGVKVLEPAAMAGSTVMPDTETHLDSATPDRSLLESFGSGGIAGLLIAGAMGLAFSSNLGPYLPIIAIAGIGATLIVSAIVYDLRR